MPGRVDDDVAQVIEASCLPIKVITCSRGSAKRERERSLVRRELGVRRKGREVVRDIAL